MIRAKPFARMLNHLAMVMELQTQGFDTIPSFAESRGKAKGKKPRGTGHKHTSYRRKMIKLRR